jgi:hypothetical protein
MLRGRRVADGPGSSARSKKISDAVPYSNVSGYQFKVYYVHCGISVPWVSQLEDENGFQAVAGPEILVLRTPVPLHGKDLRTIGEFSVAAGETVPFVLSHEVSYRPRPSAVDPMFSIRLIYAPERKISDYLMSAVLISTSFPRWVTSRLWIRNSIAFLAVTRLNTSRIS